ncbi:MAG: helicase associated domain-containing protein [Deltaproteobacteria bacterium]|nr:helicase associated domain-containing protein [Deltaproteobacteria bacterium]
MTGKRQDWWRSYELLVAFAGREGHARVPEKHVERGFKLGHWVQFQRRQRNALPAERRNALLRVSDWTWDGRNTNWDVGLTHLRDFIKRNGHARPVGRYVCKDGFRLGVWVSHCRNRCFQNKLPPDRIRCLETLPGWTWSGREMQWSLGFTHLRDFVKRHGHARPIRRYVCDDGFRLGLWVFHRRDEYMSGRLRPDRVRSLKALPGWIWSPTGKRKR